jgi:hypothetical protein
MVPEDTSLTEWMHHELQTRHAPLDPNLLPFCERRMSPRSAYSESGFLVSAGEEGLEVEGSVTCLGIRLNRKPVIAKVTFTSEGIYGCRVVVPYLFLLGVVPNAHANVIVASFTV